MPLSRSRLMLGFAKLAYRRGYHELKSELAERACRLLVYLNDADTHTQGYAATMSCGGVVVAFRGTEILSAKDRATDANLKLVGDPVSGGRVHAGFKAAVDSVFPVLEDAILQAAPAEVSVTGHSLGGALATLVAHRLHKTGREIREVITFGSPRCGDSLFAAEYNRDLRVRTLRHQNCCDIVTRVPGVLQGYRHVGQLKYHDALGYVNDDASWLYRAWDSLSARAMHFGQFPTRGIADHRVSAYLANLD